MLHGSETWPVRKEDVVALQQAEMRVVGWMTWRWWCGRAGCAGAVMCCRKMTMTGRRDVWSMGLWVRDQGGPGRTWREVVQEDCQARKMNKVDAIDRCKWRKMIKDIR